jgi:hypothetical protein
MTMRSDPCVRREGLYKMDTECRQVTVGAGTDTLLFLFRKSSYPGSSIDTYR